MKAAFLAALLLGLGACASEPGADRRTISIDIEDSAFVPDRLEVEEGETVTFVIENSDPIDHEFILGDEEVQQVHEEGTDKRHEDQAGAVSVPAGETRRTTYTFDEPGTVIYGCHIFGHYDYGMRGAVEVK